MPTLANSANALTEDQQFTPVEYGGLQAAYDHFNAELFDGLLPAVFITYQRKTNSRGYFSPERFSARAGSVGRDEVALNPDTFIGRSDEEICSTLVHEQCHVWQEHHGTRPSRGYHNKEWGATMKSVGLHPSTTGVPGGKETGARVTHYIIPNGPFARSFTRTRCHRLAAQPAIDAARRVVGRQEQQDQVHLPALRPKRLGQARIDDRLPRLQRGDASELMNRIVAFAVTGLILLRSR